MLTDTGGRRIALELELSGKGRTRLEGILAGYASDARVDAVVYLTDDLKVAHKVRGAARKLGISSLVHVQRVSFGAAGRPSAGRASERVRNGGGAGDHHGPRGPRCPRAPQPIAVARTGRSRRSSSCWPSRSGGRGSGCWRPRASRR